MTHRILLADDSATIRKVVELTFSDEDFAIDSVGDGSQALERARVQRPDIVISDVQMPGLNGYEFCQRFKDDPDLRSVPFLFLKGTFESFDEDKARACGADGFIVKPFESQEMIAKVKDLIAKAAATPAPVPAEIRPMAAPAPAFAPVAPRPDVSAPRPVSPPQPAAAPPPIPTPQPRPAPASPAMPEPPIPQWPTRPAPVMQLPAVPAPSQPTPAIHQAPPPPPVPVYQAPPPPPPVYEPPPPPPPVYQAPPPPPVYEPPPPPPQVYEPPPAPPAATRGAASAPMDDFGFDFGDAEDNRVVAPAQPAAREEPAPPMEPSGESDEDLWSEVSLRGNTTDLLEEHGNAAAGVGSGADIVELTEEAAIIAPDMLFEDETVFEEVSTARRAPLETAVAPPEVFEEAPQAKVSVPATAPQPPAPVSIDQAEIERIVSSRVDAAVRQMFEQIVGEIARTTIEAVAWEVIPDLAEAMIRSEIERVKQSTRTD